MQPDDTSLQIRRIHYNQRVPLSEDTREKIDGVERLIQQLHVQRGIENVNAKVCRYNRTEINTALKEIFHDENKWKKEEPVDRHLVDFYKDGIAIEVQFGEDSLIDIAKMQKLSREETLECAILVLATPAFADEIGAETDVAKHGYEIELIGGIDLSMSEGPQIPHHLNIPLIVFSLDTLWVRQKAVDKFKEELKLPYTPPLALQTMPTRRQNMVSPFHLPAVLTSTSLQVMWRQPYNEGTTVPPETLGEVDGVQRLLEHVDAQACDYNRDRITTALEALFAQDHWGFEGHAGRHFVDYYGYRVAVEVQLGRNPIGDIAKMQRLYNRGDIDCAILVLPMRAFGRKINAGTNVESLLYVLPEFIGALPSPTSEGSTQLRLFTLPLFVFALGTQEIKEAPVPELTPTPLPRPTGELPIAALTTSDVSSLQETPPSGSPPLPSSWQTRPLSLPQPTGALPIILPPSPGVPVLQPITQMPPSPHPRRAFSFPRTTRNLLRYAAIILVVFLVLAGSVTEIQYQIGENNAHATATALTSNALTAQSIQATGTAYANAATQYASEATQAAQATADAEAQATAQAQANAQATAQAQANAQATADAEAQATAAVIAANPDPYPPAGTLALFDPLNQSDPQTWSSGTQCQFTNGQYQVSQLIPGYFYMCGASQTFSYFAFEVRMTIIQGDCGGLSVLATDAFNLYVFFVCSNGHYSLAKYVNGKATGLVQGQSSSINQGVNQANIIALVTGGGVFNLYINNQFIRSTSDSTYGQGTIGLNAEALSNTTTVAYQDAKVWVF